MTKVISRERAWCPAVSQPSRRTTTDRARRVVVLAQEEIRFPMGGARAGLCPPGLTGAVLSWPDSVAECLGDGDFGAGQADGAKDRDLVSATAGRGGPAAPMQVGGETSFGLSIGAKRAWPIMQRARCTEHSFPSLTPVHRPGVRAVDRYGHATVSLRLSLRETRTQGMSRRRSGRPVPRRGG
jgi:hypothetical protein